MQIPNNENPIVLHPLLEPLAILCIAMINAISKMSLILYLIGVPPMSIFDDPPE